MPQSRRQFLSLATSGVLVSLPAFEALSNSTSRSFGELVNRNLKHSIKAVVRRDDTIVRSSCHGDIFPITWMSDGEQSSSLSDGYGMSSDGQVISYNTKGIFINKGPLDVTFEDVPSYPDLVSETVGHDARYYGFSALAVENVIYHFLSTAQKDSEAGWGWNGVKVIYSPDRGRTWHNQNRSTPVVWEPHADRSSRTLLFYEEPNCAFSLISHLQMGRAYDMNKDGYVYAYGTNGNTDGTMNQLVMLRVKKSRVLEREAYEFFSGRTRQGMASWERNIERRGVVHTFPSGWVNTPRRGQNVVQSWIPSVVYNDRLDLYVMASSGVGCPSNGDWFGDSRPSYLGLWIARSPWGPWDQVYEATEWTPGGDKMARCYSPQISPKWIAPDGKSLWLIWSDFQWKCGKQETEQMPQSEKGATSDNEKAKMRQAHALRCQPYYSFNAQRFDIVV